MPGTLLPTFARVEIRLASKDDLALAAAHLRTLAGELDFIAGSSDAEADALILAHHRIRATSKTLRGPNDRSDEEPGNRS